MTNPVRFSILAALVLAVVAVFVLKAAQDDGRRPAEGGAVVTPSAALSPEGLRATPAGETFQPPSYAAGVPRLVSLGSGSCIPCKKMEPVRQALRSEYAGQLVVDLIDVWDHPEAGEAFGIRLIPTLVVYDAAGRELGRLEGYISKEDLLARLEAWGVALTPPAT